MQGKHERRPPCGSTKPPLTTDHAPSHTDVFFYSYLQPKPPPNSPPWSNAQELADVNSALLRNFLSSLPLLDLHPKRILLQTGAKNYGVHLGRARVPSLESDPQPKHLEPNFYYPQEDLLFAYCAEHPETGWNVIMPAWIIGATANAQMNALHPFAVYAAVCAKRGQPLLFPGDWSGWQGYAFHSSARLTGYLSEWAVLEEKCRNQRFNSQDTSPVTWDRWFERLVDWFGVEKGVGPPPDVLEQPVVIKGKAGKDTPMGYGPPTEVRLQFTLGKWAEDEENHQAWKELMKESDGKLTHDPFEDIEAHFTFGDGAIMGVGGCMNMNKARRLGWTGFVDTVESVFEMYWVSRHSRSGTLFELPNLLTTIQEMGGDGKAGIGMVPAMKVKEPQPLV